MTQPVELTIWALLAEAAKTLPEPFSRPELMSWISRRRPDVELSSISTHIQYAVAEYPNRSAHSLGSRAPLLERVDRGLYRRVRTGAGPESAGGADVPARTSVRSAPPVQPTGVVPVARVLLVGCSQTKGAAPAPASDLFHGPGFRKASEYARRSGAPWFVLSARYGLLHPDDVIGPYDVYLGKQSAEYCAARGDWVVAQFGARLPLDGVAVEVHASEGYCAPLAAAFAPVGSPARDATGRAGAGQETGVARLPNRPSGA